MEALFGGIIKTFPALERLFLSSFNARGALAPLIKRVHFFPKLAWLKLLFSDIDGRPALPNLGKCRLLHAGFYFVIIKDDISRSDRPSAAAAARVRVISSISTST